MSFLLLGRNSLVAASSGATAKLRHRLEVKLLTEHRVPFSPLSTGEDRKNLLGNLLALGLHLLAHLLHLLGVELAALPLASTEAALTLLALASAAKTTLAPLASLTLASTTEAALAGTALWAVVAHNVANPLDLLFGQANFIGDLLVAQRLRAHLLKCQLAIPLVLSFRQDFSEALLHLLTLLRVHASATHAGTTLRGAALGRTTETALALTRTLALSSLPLAPLTLALSGPTKPGTTLGLKKLDNVLLLDFREFQFLLHVGHQKDVARAAHHSATGATLESGATLAGSALSRRTALGSGGLSECKGCCGKARDDQADFVFHVVVSPRAGCL